MYKKILFIAMIAIGCSNEPDFHIRPESVCSGDSVDKRAQFIIDCSTAANPHSDEEGEDLVAECRRTADHIYCRDAIHRLWDGHTELGVCEKLRSGPHGWKQACVNNGVNFETP